MKKLSYFVLLLLITINCKAQSRVPKDLGQGKITIGLFWFPPADTEKMDTSNHRFLQYNYYINHDTILKKGNSDVLRESLDKKQIFHKNDTLKSHLAFSMISPSYIIDWKKKLVYTFYKKSGKDYISLDSLNKYTDDIFYRTISLGVLNNVKVVFDTVNQTKVQIAGLECYKARYKSTMNKYWHQFIYTKKQLLLYPPLNCLFNNSFPYFIVSFDYESNNDSYADHQQHTAIVRLEITYISEEKLLPDLFFIPNNIPIKKNVSKFEMYH